MLMLSFITQFFPLSRLVYIQFTPYPFTFLDTSTDVFEHMHLVC